MLDINYASIKRPLNSQQELDALRAITRESLSEMQSSSGLVEMTKRRLGEFVATSLDVEMPAGKKAALHDYLVEFNRDGTMNFVCQLEIKNTSQPSRIDPNNAIHRGLAPDKRVRISEAEIRELQRPSRSPSQTRRVPFPGHLASPQNQFQQ